jgi:hypothetical protein
MKMKTKQWLGLVMLLVVVLAMGCSQTIEPEPETMGYEQLVIDDLKDPGLVDWLNQHYKEAGQYQLFNDELGDVTYLLMSYGEVPTAGYSVELDEVVVEGNQQIFKVRLIEPPTDSMVAQVISYPTILFKIITQEGIDVVGYREISREVEPTVQSEIMMYEGVRGVYVGQIDGNFIEIDLDDTFKFKELEDKMHDPMSFMLSDQAKDMLIFDDGVAVTFDFFINESGSFVISKISYAGQIDTAIEIKGIYTGRIDPTFIEVIYRGEHQVFLYSMIDNESVIEPENYSGVDISYVINEQHQKEIVSIEAADPAVTGNAIAIEASGYIEQELGFGVLQVDGEPYWEAYELLLLSSKRIEIGNSYQFTYYFDEYGRKVITSYNKFMYDTGFFDRLEDHTLYVRISGVPEEIGPKAFSLSEYATKQIKDYDFQMDDEIGFEYINLPGENNKIQSIAPLN